jgi:deazaflavin-dependent oxidoreductase (nitroreductase family)
MLTESLKTRIEHQVDTRSVDLGVWLYRRTGGRITHLWHRRAIVLTTTGRWTKRRRTVLVQVFQDGPDMFVVAANSGLPRPPGWYFNLLADSRAVGELEGRQLQLRAEQLSQSEAQGRWFQTVLKVAPDYEKYVRRTGRIPPIFRLVTLQPSRATGATDSAPTRATRMSRRRQDPLPTHEIAEGVWAIGPWGFTCTVVYLVHSGDGWSLVDAGWPGDGPGVESAVASIIGEQTPRGILLTHVHPDHEGDARKLAVRWGCPVWVSPAELPIALRDFARMRATAMPLDRWAIFPAMQLLGRARRDRIFGAATLRPVVRAFDPTGEVPGMPDWVGVPTPGHTVGHVSLFRPRDRVLLSGDAPLTARIDTLTHLLARRQGLSEPPWFTTWDAHAARGSIQRLGDLAPNIVGSGHGTPMTGPGTARAVNNFAAHTGTRAKSHGWARPVSRANGADG